MDASTFFGGLSGRFPQTLRENGGMDNPLVTDLPEQTFYLKLAVKFTFANGDTSHLRHVVQRFI